MTVIRNSHTYFYFWGIWYDSYTSKIIPEYSFRVVGMIPFLKILNFKYVYVQQPTVAV